ncbi:AlkA N-terminal domain-containing protein [Phenylobacterium sp. NIBR 498073]|uniref:AlkA N-terminal domain-containing protein n=1 Tax=Phenylobacterium sp. NIBR 498073 TaxID=3015177 RepID=UPI0022B51E9B|nr:AlkA N-terminal domain-containing protein [Phenylobacterium sp. NIBR 498073]WGU39108.1 AlkA N-terminal domain-containing protein [Phenylobacterium sp. NIBR 498073]
MDMDDDACYRAFQMRDARFDGRIFSGVTSTGIYCRPICPARTPKRENMRFYRSAAAAQEAGFRPCLRCRPETSPDLGSWRGTSNTVSRALGLIEAGALDNGDVDSLAERLGVGERQLRRLFQQHVGASPVAVAQTRRVLLAKQLLHETRMPMAEVALAAGFGSVRRFNETFQQLFDRPPAKLRRVGGAEVAAGEGGAATIRLPYRAPYDWPAMLAFLSARAIPGVEAVREGRYARSLRVGAARGVVMIDPGEGDYLKATLRFPKVEAWPAVIARVRRVFDLAADPAVIQAHLSEDPDLAPLVAARPGLRAPGAWDGFELAVRAVLGQQITVQAARMLAGKITAAHGAPLEDEAANALGLTHFFPEPAALAQADVETLAMPRARGRALVGLAAAAAADPELFGMRRSLDEAVAALRALPGIGEWTAQYIAMRALREPDAFPSADIGLMRALEGPDGVRPTAAELLARAERWRPWRAYAASHLWAADPKNPSESKHAKAA